MEYDKSAIKTKADLKDFIIGMKEDGLSYAETGKYLKCSRARVHQIINENEDTIRENRERSLATYHRKRNKILSRDNFECQFCFFSSVNLHIHHLNRNRKNNQNKNLMTLCEKCHQDLHKGVLQ